MQPIGRACARTRRTTGWLCLASAVVLVHAGAARARSGLELSSDVLQFVPVLVSGGLIAKERDWEGVKDLAISGALMSTTVVTMKYTIDAKRPDGGSHSMPSGHTATAAWGAAFTHRRFGWQAALLPYAVTGFVGWVRVEEGKHFTRDVLAGAAIGLVWGFLLTDAFDENVQLLPWSHRGANGVQLTARW